MLVIALGKGSSVQRTKENIFGLCNWQEYMDPKRIHYMQQRIYPEIHKMIFHNSWPGLGILRREGATYEGKHIWTVQLAGKPVSMTMDRDHIYVCVNGRTISLLHKGGRFIKNLINLELDGRRICYHESSNQLVVPIKVRFTWLLPLVSLPPPLFWR
jgi:hypothetical protein